MKYQSLLAIVLFHLAVFFLSCQKDKLSQSPASVLNKFPIAIAGDDQAIIVPRDSVLLDGSNSSDPDGRITRYSWKKIGGASSTITNMDSAKTIVNGLEISIYSFELTVTDNKGATAKDTVLITVSLNPVGNQPPMADAGPDQLLIWPANTVFLNGIYSTDPDNNITSYEWTIISGSSTAVIQNANSSQTSVSSLLLENYQFQLKVTDAGGLIDSDTMIVAIYPPSIGNPWVGLGWAPTFGTETFIIGIDTNNIFVGSGYDHKFWKFNHLSNTWTQRANVPGVAYDYLVKFAANGKGYVGMGYNVNTTYNEMFEYNPITNQWIQKNNSPMSGAAATFVIDNIAYIVQGSSLWMYTATTDSYIQKNNVPFYNNLGDNNTFVLNNIGYLITGAGCWKYEVATDSWSQKASLPGYIFTRAGYSLNNYGYILGDSSQATYNNNYPLQLFKYDPSLDLWSRINNNYPGGGAYAIKSTSLDGRVYMGFGYNNGDWPVGDFWKFQ